DASQNGLRVEAPQRHSSVAPRVSTGVGSSQPIGSPNSVSTCAVRTTGGEPTSSYGPSSEMRTRKSCSDMAARLRGVRADRPRPRPDGVVGFEHMFDDLNPEQRAAVLFGFR